MDVKVIDTDIPGSLFIEAYGPLAVLKAQENIRKDILSAFLTVAVQGTGV